MPNLRPRFSASGSDDFQRFAGAVHRIFSFGLARGDRFGDEVFRYLGDALFAAFEQFLQFAGIILQIHAAEMQHHERRADALGKFKRVERVLDGELAVAARGRRKIRRGSATGR